MAVQIQNEKISLFSSNLDKKHFTKNDASDFINYVYPIQQYREFNYVKPMMISIPITKNYLIINPKYVNKIQEFTSDTYITTLNVAFDDDEIQVDFYFNLFPLFYFKNEEFILPFSNIEKLFLFDFSVQFKNFTDRFFLIKWKTHDAQRTVLLVTLKHAIDDHETVTLKTPKTFNIISDWFNFDLTLSQDTYDLLPNKLTDDNSYFNDTWSDETIEEIKNRWEKGTPYIYFAFMVLKSNDIIFNLPDDFFINSGSGSLTDNEQIFIHNEKIKYNRIANQNEGIFQDLYLDESSIKETRLTDYISIPMFIPLKLSSNVLELMDFQLLNNVGETNKYIDKKRSTFILCKFIKNYNFIDGKKKIEFTNSVD